MFSSHKNALELFFPTFLTFFTDSRNVVERDADNFVKMFFKCNKNYFQDNYLLKKHLQADDTWGDVLSNVAGQPQGPRTF